MAISKTRKEELLAQYGDLIGKSDAIFLAEYAGMSVKAMNNLRDEVYKADGAFHVTKNTLLKRALEDAERSVPEDMLLGQLASGFALGEAPTLAKALVDFAKKEDNLTLKGGFLGDELLTADQIEALAKLPSLDQLRSQLIGLINGPAQGIVSAVTNGVRQVVNVLDAYAKEEGEAEAA
ncbi:MAG: 50S ribosomal protein L10 [Anaerolineales bacterium]|nr:50S ribosomal protein L10 [Anaerolineales bacterium]